MPGNMVLVSEVGPRDGLQSIPIVVPTAAKLRWIAALASAGLTEIEIGSFVSAKRLPQMSDCAAVVKGALELKGLVVSALAPNAIGAERAMSAGVHKVTMPVSASETHSQRNIRLSTDEAIAQVAKVCSVRDAMPPERRPQVEVGISTAFGCPFEGEVAEDRVIDIAASLAALGVDSVGLSDTIGVANPWQVKRLFKRLIAEIGSHSGAAHLHNTLGLGLANVVSALEAGVCTFDASQAGLGGCPYAPGATGNVVTEDLVYMLDRMGLRTGIDLSALLCARSVLAEALPNQSLHGYVPNADIPCWPLGATVVRRPD